MPLNTEQHPSRLVMPTQGDKQVAYCRCWQSKRFPFCDGSHRAYNAAGGDALGPLVLVPEHTDASE